MMPDRLDTPKLDRRNFFKEGTIFVLGLLTLLPASLAALAVVCSPLRRTKGRSDAFVAVAALAALPEDGTPRKFSVTTSRIDAWNTYANIPVGAVYLRRTGPASVEAFNAICPHAGGFIDYVAREKCFLCPLHNSQFALDGSIQGRQSPSPRPMDALAVEIRGDEVWVKFEDFQAGIARKIPA